MERAGDIAARVSSLEPSDPLLRRGLHIVVALIVVLGVGLAAVAAIGDFPDVDWRFRPLALMLSVLLFTAFLIPAADVWRRLLRALGPEVGLVRAQAIWFTSALGRYVPTALLLPMLRVAMAGREGVPRRVALASVAYELPLFLTANFAVGAYFVITLPDLEGEWARYLVLVFPAVAVIALQPRIFHPLADRALVRMGREPLPVSLPGRRILEFVALYAVILVLAGLSVYCLAQSVYPVGASDLPTVIGSFAVGTTLSYLAFIIPGGLGAREAGMALALYPIMPAAPALAIAVLSRILQLALEVALAIVMPLLARSAEHPPGGDTAS
jgi:glycosyltransferase 2 family protein